MEGHVKAVAIIHIISGAILLLIGLAGLFLFGGIAAIVSQNAPSDDARVAVPILGLIGGLAFLFFLIFSLPDIAAGIGLLRFAEWARILTIVISILDLMIVPIGTIIGAYSLWVLFNNQTLPLFRPGQAPAPASPVVHP